MGKTETDSGRFILISREITKRKHTEAALEESRFFFQESQRAANVGSYKTVFSKSCWESSDVLDKIFGIDKDFVRSVDGWLEIIHPEDRDMMQKYLRDEVIEQRRAFDKEYRIIHQKTGEIRWILGLGQMEFDSMGNGVCLMGTIHDVTDRKKTEDHLEKTLQELQGSLLGTIDVISQIVDMRDPYTADHQRKVSVLSEKIAERMGLPKDRITELRMAALIHDIGKISVAAEILAKPSKLKNSEFDLVRDHVQSGFDALLNSGLSEIVKRGVLEHHERLDGSGYPHGLKGDQISPETRILSVADVVDAMSSHRPYRASLGIEAAMDEIRKFRGTRYDPAVVDACLELFAEKRPNPNGK
jgi:PAS domain S-box-containing protein/putative nucleotidyltransferase with HDIG domain